MVREEQTDLSTCRVFTTLLSTAFSSISISRRLKPDLLIELGTAWGGLVFFNGMIVTAYNPDIHTHTHTYHRSKENFCLE